MPFSLKLLEAAKWNQMGRTGGNKTPLACVKEQFPEAPLVLPTHNELLSFPREAVGEGGTQILQKEFIIQFGSGDTYSSGKLSDCAFVISTSASSHVAEHAVGARCLHCLKALYESRLCCTGFLF